MKTRLFLTMAALILLFGCVDDRKKVTYVVIYTNGDQEIIICEKCWCALPTIKNHKVGENFVTITGRTLYGIREIVVTKCE